MTRRTVTAVGIHSIYMDHRIGSPDERHVIFCDLDSKALQSNPMDFRLDLMRPMNRFGVGIVYLFETQKGYHAFSPTLLPRKDTERFEEALTHWGGDGIHRTMSYRNGGAVLRVTPKTGEGQPCEACLSRLVCANYPTPDPQCCVCQGIGWTGPAFRRAFTATALKPTPDLPPWSRVHFEFFNSLHHNALPPPPAFARCDTRATTIRLEHYETTEAHQEPNP